ncbi:sigma-70 family RNA polymerase sigma factor [Sediminibacillus halophilus]|uniref:RNA polymerase sigma-70 factor, ECF subfamily n=1 Tax=Sediminibacillus halophilus TaxID=482461 RepID=A0A1G9T806_9BACI|nr:sigma-70 family RNA polymerase sigma factor [Sediminibacillus halophilus]SDM43777.1 RNA polymerase sigma-70 factor, ECF subfamily [Sediminibacillus halophilus]
MDDQELEFEEIMDRYGTDIKRIVYMYVRDYSLADDITQETFIKCFTHYHQFRGDSLRNWLIQIAVNRSKDYLRSAYKKRTLLGDSLINLLKSPSVETKVLEKSIEDDVTACLMNLPVKYREIITLYYYKELTIKEISDTLEKNENTIKSRLRRAKDLLKKEVSKNG